ncbi:hypothetical protein ABH920_008446 [Catenulispora sp. EB89]
MLCAAPQLGIAAPTQHRAPHLARAWFPPRYRSSRSSQRSGPALRLIAALLCPARPRPRREASPLAQRHSCRPRPPAAYPNSPNVPKPPSHPASSIRPRRFRVALIRTTSDVQLARIAKYGHVPGGSVTAHSRWEPTADNARQRGQSSPRGRAPSDVVPSGGPRPPVCSVEGEKMPWTLVSVQGGGAPPPSSSPGAGAPAPGGQPTVRPRGRPTGVLAPPGMSACHSGVAFATRPWHST